MTGWLLVGVALAGGLGSALRFLVDGAVTRRLGPTRGWGTSVVNVTGSFALGLVAGFAAALGPGATVLGTGLLGGYTTFSTATWEAVTMVRRRRAGAAVAHTAGLLAACLVAAAAGLALAGG